MDWQKSLRRDLLPVLLGLIIGSSLGVLVGLEIGFWQSESVNEILEKNEKIAANLTANFLVKTAEMEELYKNMEELNRTVISAEQNIRNIERDWENRQQIIVQPNINIILNESNLTK